MGAEHTHSFLERRTASRLWAGTSYSLRFDRMTGMGSKRMAALILKMPKVDINKTQHKGWDSGPGELAYGSPDWLLGKLFPLRFCKL